MVGTIIKNARRSKGLSQKQLGDLLSLADNTISSYERGNNQPDFKTIIEILNICDFQIQFINDKSEIITLEKMSREL